MDFTVEEVVALGRTPHKRPLDRDTGEDRAICRDALARVGMAGAHQHSYATLSGGEKQRVLIARALAQRSHLHLLDEPTNHLDVRYQLEILGLVRGLGHSTLAAIHDLNLAAAQDAGTPGGRTAADRRVAALRVRPPGVSPRGHQASDRRSGASGDTRCRRSHHNGDHPRCCNSIALGDTLYLARGGGRLGGKGSLMSELLRAFGTALADMVIPAHAFTPRTPRWPRSPPGPARPSSGWTRCGWSSDCRWSRGRGTRSRCSTPRACAGTPVPSSSSPIGLATRYREPAGCSVRLARCDAPAR